MISKVFFSLIGFGAGAYLLLHGLFKLLNIKDPQTITITPFDQIRSVIILSLVACILILWTYFLVRRKKV
ncbi:MAG: hypothetical protein S4CHLAM6_10510 [Chlamydiae bacterium]|nr:hypothetical protein [Chlamydiota bacterium]